MSNIPPAVRAQAAKADELIAQQRAAATPATPAQDAATAPAEPSVEAQPATPPAAQVPATTETPPPASAGEDWEHKYRVLQGMHQADVQRNRQLTEENRELRSLLSRVQQAHQQAQAQAQATPPAQPAAKLVKPEEVAEYGAEFMDMVARAAKEQYQPVIEQLQSTISSLESKLNTRVEHVEQVATMSAKDAFFVQLDRAMPTWEKLNVDPGFLAWLDSPDELTGFVRREIFNRASSSFDAPRVLKFFTTYAASQAPAPATPASTLAPSVPLDSLVAPSKTTTAPVAGDSRKVYSRAEIAAFYENCRKGTYRGRDAERRRIESDIFAAGREGRIQ